MSIARAVGRNTLFTAIGRLSVLVVWFMVTPWVLRALGPERFGLWSLLLVLSGSLAALDLGLGVALTRYVAELVGRGRVPEVRRLMARTGALQLGIASLLVVPCLLLRDVLLGGVHVPAAWVGEARDAFAWTLAAFVIGMVSNLAVGTLQGLQRMDLAALVFVPAAVALGLAIVTAMHGAQPLVRLAQVQVAYSVVVTAALLVAVLVVTRRGTPLPAGAEPVSLRRMLRFGGWLQATNLLFLGQSQLDKLLLGWFVALGPVGVYELGWRAAYAITLPPFFFLAALLPAVAQHEATADAAARRAIYVRTLDPYFQLVIGLGAAAFALAPALLETWLRTPPAFASYMLRTVVLAQAANLLTGPVSTMARAVERAEIETRYVATGLALHVALSGCGLAWFGWRAVPVGFALSTVLAATWFIARMERLLGLPALAASGRALAPALAASAPSAAVAWVVAGLVPGIAGSRVHGLLALGAGGVAFLVTFALILGVFFRERARALWERARAVAS